MSSGRIFLAFLVAVALKADSISEQLTFNGQTLGTLGVNTLYDPASDPSTPNDAIIRAGFTTPGSLDSLTAQLGANHFNWVQVVASGTPGVTPKGVPYPVIDPLSGGNAPEQPDDHIPFYLNESGGNDSDLAKLTSENEVRFEDQPGQLDPNATLHFQTYLAAATNPPGQETPSPFGILAGFTWTFTENALGNGTTITDLAFVQRDMLQQQAAFVNSALAEPYNFPSWSVPTTATPEPRFGFFGALMLLLPLVLRSRLRAKCADHSGSQAA